MISSLVEQEKYINYISNPELWIQPVCPVIKGVCRSDESFGIIVPWDLTTVALCLMWGLTKEKYDSSRKIYYSSVEELVKDGWRVD